MTETGRQPWIATNILRTIDAASPVAYSSVLITLILFVVVYVSVFSMGIYYINRLIERGPVGPAIEPQGTLPSRPLSAASDAARDAIRPES